MLASLSLVVNAGIEDIVDFMIPAVAASTLNFVYLMLGRRVVSLLRWQVLWQHRALQVVPILMVANAMFVGSWIVLFSFHGGIVAAAIFGLVCAVTNLIPIILVSAFPNVLHFLQRALCSFVAQRKIA